ncbi:hypothetical protein ACIRXL_10890 [Avibacterium paragallinarum]
MLSNSNCAIFRFFFHYF